MARARREVRSGCAAGEGVLASLAYLASCFAFVLVRDRWAIATVVTLVAILATAILLPKTVVTQVVGTKSGPMRWLLLLAPLILGFALLSCTSLADEPDGWGFFGLATAYIGAGVLVSFTRRHERVSQWLGAGLVVVVRRRVRGGARGARAELAPMVDGADRRRRAAHAGRYQHLQRVRQPLDDAGGSDNRW